MAIESVPGEVLFPVAPRRRHTLPGVRRAQGDPSAADALLRQVVEWSHGPIAGAGRVTFFRRLGGDPVAMAAAQLDPATQPT